MPKHASWILLIFLSVFVTACHERPAPTGSNDSAKPQAADDSEGNQYPTKTYFVGQYDSELWAMEDKPIKCKLEQVSDTIKKALFHAEGMDEGVVDEYEVEFQLSEPGMWIGTCSIPDGDYTLKAMTSSDRIIMHAIQTYEYEANNHEPEAVITLTKSTKAEYDTQLAKTTNSETPAH